jgi:hypothetical protein
VNIRKHIRTIAAATLPVAAAIIAIVIAIGGETANARGTRQEPPPGAELVIFDDSAGPYNVKISQSPARAVVGTIRIVIEPVDAETGLSVENAIVRVSGTPPGDGERQFSPALNSPTDRRLYFGQIVLEVAGLWTFDVEIDAPQGRAVAIAQTTIYGRARSSNGPLVGTILFILVSGGFTGGGLWLWVTSKAARKRRDLISKGGGNPRKTSG